MSRELRHYFEANGFNQVINFSMVSPSDAQRLGWKPSDHLEIANPLTPELSIMRESILPSLLKVISHDMARQQNRGRIYELGSVFRADGSEALMISGVMYGDLFGDAYRPEDKLDGADVLRLKGLLTGALDLQQVVQLRTETLSDDTRLHPGQSGTIFSLKQELGRFGQVHPALLKQYSISQKVAMFELSVDALLKAVRPLPKYKAYPNLPFTRRDIAMLVPKSLPYKDIESVISKSKPKLCKRCFLVDRFESDALGPDKVSLALGFIYQDDEVTLTDAVVNAAHTDFVAALSAALPIEIR
jgi:phenylalanyl-tRNA synthetase beta chain